LFARGLLAKFLPAFPVLSLHGSASRLQLMT
jgi:hypothetical protein